MRLDQNRRLTVIALLAMGANHYRQVESIKEAIVAALPPTLLHPNRITERVDDIVWGEGIANYDAPTLVDRLVSNLTHDEEQEERREDAQSPEEGTHADA